MLTAVAIVGFFVYTLNGCTFAHVRARRRTFTHDPLAKTQRRGAALQRYAYGLTVTSTVMGATLVPRTSRTRADHVTLEISAVVLLE